MKNLKPFVLGCSVGASLIFIALQYHVVHSHDGFQFVPRTPQHSLGLTYANVRNWDAAQWADRPELARALMAHGSSDLIASSVADNLADSITSENSTLDQLRSFINESPAKGNDTDDLLSDPVFSPRPDRPAVDTVDDVFRVPFPDSVRQIQPLRQLTESAPSVSRPSVLQPSVAQNAGLSVDDVFSSGIGGLRQDLKPDTYEPNTRGFGDSADRPLTTQEIRRETNALEDLLFGDDANSPANTNTETRPETGGIFQDVTSVLDRRATDALARARVGLQEELNGTLTDGSNMASGYVRDRSREFMPESVSSMFAETGGTQPAAESAIDPFRRVPEPGKDEVLPNELKALRDGFDPFLNSGPLLDR